MAVGPFQLLPDLLPLTLSRLPGGAGSLAAGHFSHLFLLPKLLISDLSVIHHSPALNSPFTIPSDACKSHCGNSQHSIREEEKPYCET